MHFGPYSFQESNLDKILFSGEGITKGQLISYYIRISELMLPLAKDRPLAMHRFPDGIGKKGFFQKEVPDYFPSWIKRVEVSREEGRIIMPLVNNKATLAYLANQACIEPHIFLSRVTELKKPDRIIFDLDPPENRFDLVIKAARALKVLLEADGLTPYIMTTGSSGMHIYVPVRPDHPFEIVRGYARQICEQLTDQQSDIFTTEIRKNKRGNRLFLDYLRNSYGQHSIVPYSVRALPGAPIATPLKWEEIDQLDNGSRTFNLSNIFDRVDRYGNVWINFTRHASSLPTAKMKSYDA